MPPRVCEALRRAPNLRPPPTFERGQPEACGATADLQGSCGGRTLRDANVRPSSPTAAQGVNERNDRFTGASRSPLTDSNRRPPLTMNVRGADSRGFAPSDVGSSASLIAAVVAADAADGGECGQCGDERRGSDQCEQ